MCTKASSAISGGLAAIKAYPAKVIVLVISDVIGDHLDTIGSGPFYPDETTFEDALKVIKKYDLGHRIPESVKTYLNRACWVYNQKLPKETQFILRMFFIRSLHPTERFLMLPKDVQKSLDLKLWL